MALTFNLISAAALIAVFLIIGQAKVTSTHIQEKKATAIGMHQKGLEGIVRNATRPNAVLFTEGDIKEKNYENVTIYNSCFNGQPGLGSN